MVRRQEVSVRSWAVAGAERVFSFLKDMPVRNFSRASGGMGWWVWMR